MAIGDKPYPFSFSVLSTTRMVRGSPADPAGAERPGGADDRLEESQRQRPEARADLEHHLVSLQPGVAHDRLQEIRVGEEVLAEADHGGLTRNLKIMPGAASGLRRCSQEQDR